MKRPAPLAIAIAIVVLTGCSVYGPPPASHHYVLAASPAPAPASAAASRIDVALLVLPSSVASFYGTRQIVYSRAAGTRDHYQFSSWTETPDKSLNAMLLDRLRQSGTYRSVAAATSGVGGELLLTTRLDEIYHDATTAPGTAKVTLTAELSDPVRRTSVARRVFVASAPVATFDADGAVNGLRAALAAAVNDEAAWVASVTGR